jgi:hypothetical protein
MLLCRLEREGKGTHPFRELQLFDCKGDLNDFRNLIEYAGRLEHATLNPLSDFKGLLDEDVDEYNELDEKDDDYHGQACSWDLHTIFPVLLQHQRWLKTFVIGQMTTWIPDPQTLQKVDLSGFEALESVTIPRQITGVDCTRNWARALDDRTPDYLTHHMEERSWLDRSGPDPVANLVTPPKLRHLEWVAVPNDEGLEWTENHRPVTIGWSCIYGM